MFTFSGVNLQARKGLYFEFTMKKKAPPQKKRNFNKVKQTWKFSRPENFNFEDK